MSGSFPAPRGVVGAAELDFDPCSIATIATYNIAQGVIEDSRLTAPHSLYMFDKTGAEPAAVTQELIPISPLFETDGGREVQLALSCRDLGTDNPDIGVIALTRGDVAVWLGGFTGGSNEASCDHFEIAGEEIIDKRLIGLAIDEVDERGEIIDALKELLSLDIDRGPLVRQSLVAAEPDLNRRIRYPQNFQQSLRELITKDRRGSLISAPGSQARVALSLLAVSANHSRLGRIVAGLPGLHVLSWPGVVKSRRELRAFDENPSLGAVLRGGVVGSDIPVIRDQLIQRALLKRALLSSNSGVLSNEALAKATRAVASALKVDERFDDHLGTYNPEHERIIRSIGQLVARETVEFRASFDHSGGRQVPYNYKVVIERDGSSDVLTTSRRPYELTEEEYKKGEVVRIDRTEPGIDPDTLEAAAWLIDQVGQPRGGRNVLSPRDLVRGDEHNLADRTKEELTGQLDVAYEAYSTVVSTINKLLDGVDKIELVDPEVIKSEFEAWMSDPKARYATSLIQRQQDSRSDDPYFLTLAITPNIELDINQIRKLVAKFDDSTYPDFGIREYFGKLTAAQLSGTNPDSDTNVIFSITPNEPEPYGQNPHMQSLEQYYPFLRILHPLEAIVLAETMSRRNRRNGQPGTRRQVRILHFNLPIAVMPGVDDSVVHSVLTSRIGDSDTFHYTAGGSYIDVDERTLSIA